LWNLLALFQDRRPKVRKAAYNGAVELLVVEDGLHVPQSLKDHCAYHAELTKAQRDKKSVQNETPVDLMHVISFLNEPFCILDHTKIGTDIMELLAVLFRGMDLQRTCRHGESAEATPKVLAIGALLSTVLVLLEDSSAERRL
jgi:hypothetical protein